MTAIAIPEDVAAHLQAAIQLSNRRVQTRLLKEAPLRANITETLLVP
jgi:hypothetical protein